MVRADLCAVKIQGEILEKTNHQGADFSNTNIENAKRNFATYSVRASQALTFKAQISFRPTSKAQSYEVPVSKEVILVVP
jgi:uncharacterized protein YjbI with pentapeptide repeats